MQLKQYIATIDFDMHSPETPWAIYFDDYLQCRFAFLNDAEVYILSKARLIKMTANGIRARGDYKSIWQDKYVEIEE